MIFATLATFSAAFDFSQKSPFGLPFGGSVWFHPTGRRFFPPFRTGVTLQAPLVFFCCDYYIPSLGAPADLRAECVDPFFGLPFLFLSYRIPSPSALFSFAGPRQTLLSAHPFSTFW